MRFESPPQTKPQPQSMPAPESEPQYVQIEGEPFYRQIEVVDGQLELIDLARLPAAEEEQAQYL